MTSRFQNEFAQANADALAAPWTPASVYKLLPEHSYEFSVSFTPSADLKEGEPSEDNRDRVSNGNWQVLRGRHALNATKAFGCVFYMDDSEYSDDKERNAGIHFPFLNEPDFDIQTAHKLYLSLLQSIFIVFYPGIPVKDVVIGHEHGSENKKCHLQCVVKINGRTQKVLSPHRILLKYKIDGVDHQKIFLFMAAKANDLKGKNLEYYCKKDGDWFTASTSDIPFVYKYNSKGETTGINVYATLEAMRKEGHFTSEEASELVATYAPQDWYKWRSNILPNILNDFSDSAEPFQWVPNERVFNLYPKIKEWFYRYCAGNEVPERKKALLLYSEKRAMGKSYFARGLVNNAAYVQEFHNNFVVPTCKEPHIIIIDDFRAPDEAQGYSNWETFKKAISSELTQIRDCKVNVSLPSAFNGVPCIICTNKIKFLKSMLNSTEFNTQIIPVVIDQYLGPPGTQREDLMTVEYGNTDAKNIAFLDSLRVDPEKKREEYLQQKRNREDAPLKIAEQLDQLNSNLLNVVSSQKRIEYCQPPKKERKVENNIPVGQDKISFSNNEMALISNIFNDNFQVAKGEDFKIDGECDWGSFFK